MYFSFILNNLHFALELLGGIVFLMMSWLSFDAYLVSKDAKIFLRACGFTLLGLASVFHGLNYENDLLSYMSIFFNISGLFLILGSFLKEKKLEVMAILVIPSFSLWSGNLFGLSAILALGVAFLCFKKYKLEFNRSWLPLSIGFLLIGFSNLLKIFVGTLATDVFFIGAHLFELVGFVFFVIWVWQYLQLRIRESLILIFVSVALFIATLVTLAFSTILIDRITKDAEGNLLTNVKVFNQYLSGLQDESLAKVRIIALDKDLLEAIKSKDFDLQARVMERLLQEEKLGFLTLADKDGNVLTRAHALTKRGDSVIDSRVFEEAILGNSFVTIENDLVEKISVRAGTPIFVGKNIEAVLLAGYFLDNAMVDGVKKLTGLDMFVYDTERSFASTALLRDGKTRMINFLVTDPKIKNNVLELGQSLTARMQMFGEPMLVSFLPIHNADQKIIGMISATKSEQGILDLANATNRLTLITVILIMLVISLPIYIFTKRLNLSI